jgi:Na+/pantothenate symporter
MVICWLIRIVFAILIFVVVYVGGAWLLNAELGLDVPDLLIKALAALIAFLWFFGDYRYGWISRSGPVA